MGLGLECTGRSERGLSARVGSLALVIAACGTALYVLRATRFGEIYTDWTRPVPEALVLALPYYLALLGMVVPAVPISFAVHRERVGPPWLRAASLITAVLGVSVFVLMTIASYDSMWAFYMGPFGLDVPTAGPLLPQKLLPVTSNLGPAFMGGWMALTCLQLGIRTLPRVLCLVGIITGAAIIATMPYALDNFAFGTLLPVELFLSLVWATACGMYLITAKRATETVAPLAG